MARILSVFQYSFPGAQFLTFEHVTLVPYEPKLIDYSLLSEVQVSRPNAPRRVRHKHGVQPHRMARVIAFRI